MADSPFRHETWKDKSVPGDNAVGSRIVHNGRPFQLWLRIVHRVPGRNPHDVRSAAGTALWHRRGNQGQAQSVCDRRPGDQRIDMSALAYAGSV